MSIVSHGRWATVLWLATSLGLVSACGGDDDSGGSGGTSATGGSGGTSATGGSGGTTTGGSGGTTTTGGSGGTTGGAAGTGGSAAGAGGTGGTTAAVIPANTTDCTLNSANCLESTGSVCFIELTAPIAGAAVDVRVDGTLRGGMNGMLEVNAFGVSNGYQWSGYTAHLGRSGDTINRSLHDDTTLTLESDSWSAPTAGADYPLAILTSFNTGTTSGSVKVEAASAPTTALSTTAMKATTSDKLVLTVSKAEVCNVVVTTP
jgi:hypothetical protein